MAGLVLCGSVAAAHMVSISTGQLLVEGATVRYELRMPLYEVEYIEDPEQTLFEHFHLSSSGNQGRLAQRRCREEYADGIYLCEAVYEFPDAVEQVEVECSFHAVTTPNHVHILRATRGDTTDQAVFDLTVSRAEINFIPPSAAEVAFQQIAAGMVRAAGGAAALLFLAALVVAARQRRELAALIGMFLAGQLASCLIVPLSGWQPAPRFVEAAAALTIAYLAVEILLLPKAGQRWLVVGVLGIFHGLYLALFISGSGYSVAYVLTGVALAEVMLVAVFGTVLARIHRALKAIWPLPRAIQPVQVSAGLLLVVGMAWFFVRLRG